MARKLIIRRVCDLHEAGEVVATQTETIRRGPTGRAGLGDRCLSGMRRPSGR